MWLRQVSWSASLQVKISAIPPDISQYAVRAGGFICASADLLFPNTYDQDTTKQLITAFADRMQSTKLALWKCGSTPLFLHIRACLKTKLISRKLQLLKRAEELYIWCVFHLHLDADLWTTYQRCKESLFSLLSICICFLFCAHDKLTDH